MSSLPPITLIGTSAMNILRFLTGLALLGVVPTAGLAASIAEPPSVFYGRIYQRIGDWDFTITEGQLAWTIANLSLPGQSYRIATPIKPAGRTGLSYLVRIPHQVLAYDLTVESNNVPLTAGGFQFQHQNITVNGQSAVLVAPAVDAFTARQTARAGTYRIDLEVPTLSPDSDGDGIPDWWEDKYGTDKWDPYDGPSVLAGNPGGDARDTTDDGVMTFGEWRDKQFPGDTRDLDLVGSEDPDQDGVANLVEYAFNLNPKVALENRGRLPRGRLDEDGFVLEYEQHADATDLAYAIQISHDLLTWRDATAEDVTQDVQEGEDVNVVSVRPVIATADTPLLYLRVVVSRIP